METKMVYLDTYVLQKDMRLRLPKAIIENMHLTKGESEFDIYFDKDNQHIVLAVHNSRKLIKEEGV